MTGTNSLAASSGYSGGTLSASFAPIAGGVLSSVTTEAQYQFELGVASTFSKLTVGVKSAVASNTFTFRKGASNGNQTVTQAVGQGYTTDSTHSDAALSTDLIDIAFGSGGSIVQNLNSITMTQNAATPQVAYSNGILSKTFAVANNFAQLIGSNSIAAATENGNSQSFLFAAGTLSQMAAFVSAASTGNITLTLRANGANGNETLAIGSGSTGLFRDTTHSDAVISGNPYDTAYISTNASGTLLWTYYNFAGTLSAHALITGDSNDFNGNFFNFAGGSCSLANVSEANTPMQVNYAVTMSHLSQWLGSAGSCVVSTRNNLGAGNQTTTRTAAAGPVSDITHTDAVTAGNFFGGTNNNNSISGAAVNIDDGSSTGSHPFSFGSVAG